jgi:hypothetical protein
MTDQQASNVLPFRRKRRRRSKRNAPAEVFAFPSSRHIKIVEFIAREMLKQRSLDAAEERLTDHLHVEWSRLAELGVPDHEIEQQIGTFARAAWQIVFKDRGAEGVA